MWQKLIGMLGNQGKAGLTAPQAEAGSALAALPDPLGATQGISSSMHGLDSPGPVPGDDAVGRAEDRENVVSMPARRRPTARDARNYGATQSNEDNRNGLRLQGLMDDPMLQEFFKQNHWNYGYYDGSHYKSSQAMELGKSGITARFENMLANYVSRKQAHLTKLQATIIEIRGVCAMTTAQLELAARHVEADIETLKVQVDLSRSRQGWVADALNRYEIGFVKGLRDTIPFDHLV